VTDSVTCLECGSSTFLVLHDVRSVGGRMGAYPNGKFQCAECRRITDGGELVDHRHADSQGRERLAELESAEADLDTRTRRTCPACGEAIEVYATVILRKGGEPRQRQG
jgi:ribosomal protein S27AE